MPMTEERVPFLEFGAKGGESIEFDADSGVATFLAFRGLLSMEGINSQEVEELAILAVENRFGWVNTLPQIIEWLTDNGSCFIAEAPNGCSGALAWKCEQRRYKFDNQTEWPRLWSKP